MTLRAFAPMQRYLEVKSITLKPPVKTPCMCSSIIKYHQAYLQCIYSISKYHHNTPFEESSMSDTTKAAPEPPKVPEPPKARSHGATGIPTESELKKRRDARCNRSYRRFKNRSRRIQRCSHSHVYLFLPHHIFLPECTNYWIRRPLKSVALLLLGT